MQKINTKVLMSGADFFNDGFAINAHMDDQIPVDLEQAKREHSDIKSCFEQAGIKVIQVPPPEGCQDGVYTANWALVRGDKAVMGNLPNKRQPEQSYADSVLKSLGKQVVRLPQDLAFSGQGDALPVGKYLFIGSHYRTNLEAHQLIAKELDFELVSVQTIPQVDGSGKPVTNPVTGWPDSFFYDLDLALAVISPKLIAWCPEAFFPESQVKIRAITDLEKIEVSLEEAMQGFACNLVSTGETVVMSARAPKLKSELECRRLGVLTPEVSELLKGGGFIRCTSLTLE